MKGKKQYSVSKGAIFSTVYDIIELQNGDMILSDTARGLLYYKLTMYDYEWELMYTITESGFEKSDVTLRLIGDRQDKVQEIRREFALLEMMLGGGADVTIMDN
jgi:hypothetical protein